MMSHYEAVNKYLGCTLVSPTGNDRWRVGTICGTTLFALGQGILEGKQREIEAEDAEKWLTEGWTIKRP